MIIFLLRVITLISTLIIASYNLNFVLRIIVSPIIFQRKVLHNENKKIVFVQCSIRFKVINIVVCGESDCCRNKHHIPGDCYCNCHYCNCFSSFNATNVNHSK